MPYTLAMNIQKNQFLTKQQQKLRNLAGNLWERLLPEQQQKFKDIPVMLRGVQFLNEYT